jgi:MerR family transcriptional regulator/heat shock protein HspR
MSVDEITEEERKRMALYPIGIAAELLGTTDQTLRLYEKHGLISPLRRNKNRYYSENDIKWLKCVRDLIHNKKISIEGVKKLLEYAPCWEIKDCPTERRDRCSAFVDRSKPCYELNRTRCKKDPDQYCEECIIYLASLKSKNEKRNIKATSS